MLQDTVRTLDNPVFYGIGNAVIDIYAEAETFQEPLKKDEFLHVENSILDSILNSGIIEKMRTPGGSAVNTLKTAAHFGAQCFFSGSTGTELKNSELVHDENARFIYNELKAAGIEAQLYSRLHPTGRCLIVKDENDCTAFAASPSAAKFITEDQINEIRLSHSNCVILEGLAFTDMKILSKVTELCLYYNLPLAINAASVYGAEAIAPHLEDLSTILDIYLFANEEEAKILCEKSSVDPKEYCRMFVVTKGKNGAEAWYNDSHAATDALPAVEVDTTGAGDAFAGAFLYRWFSSEQTENQLSECLKFGSEAAKHVVEQLGCTWTN